MQTRQQNNVCKLVFILFFNHWISFINLAKRELFARDLFSGLVPTRKNPWNFFLRLVPITKNLQNIILRLVPNGKKQFRNLILRFGCKIKKLNFAKISFAIISSTKIFSFKVVLSIFIWKHAYLPPFWLRIKTFVNHCKISSHGCNGGEILHKMLKFAQVMEKLFQSGFHWAFDMGIPGQYDELKFQALNE